MSVGRARAVVVGTGLNTAIGKIRDAMKNHGGDDEEEMTLVGSGDEDYDAGKYLITSPIGQGLFGRKIGEEVEIEVPSGTLKFKILEIRYE